MKVEMVPIDSIRRYEKNPRRNAGAVAKVAESLKTFGWRQPIVVDKARVIIVGDTRYQAAQSLGMKAVPVHVADNLTPAQVKAYRLADNRVGEEALWDDELLIGEVRSLEASERAMTGFDSAELDLMLKGEEAANEAAKEALGDAPESVQKNVEHLAEIYRQRAEGNANVVGKTDTERYLVIVFASREAREVTLKKLGLPPDERYLSAAGVEVKLKRGRSREAILAAADRPLAAAPQNKAGATG